MIASPLARTGVTRAYLQTDLSLHYPACTLPRAEAWEGETSLLARLSIALFFFFYPLHKTTVMFAQVTHATFKYKRLLFFDSYFCVKINCWLRVK